MIIYASLHTNKRCTAQFWHLLARASDYCRPTLTTRCRDCDQTTDKTVEHSFFLSRPWHLIVINVYRTNRYNLYGALQSPLTSYSHPRTVFIKIIYFIFYTYLDNICITFFFQLSVYYTHNYSSLLASTVLCPRTIQ